MAIYTEVRVLVIVDSVILLKENYCQDAVTSYTYESLNTISDALQFARMCSSSVKKDRNENKIKDSKLTYYKDTRLCNSVDRIGTKTMSQVNVRDRNPLETGDIAQNKMVADKQIGFISGIVSTFRYKDAKLSILSERITNTYKECVRNYVKISDTSKLVDNPDLCVFPEKQYVDLRPRAGDNCESSHLWKERIGCCENKTDFVMIKETSTKKQQNSKRSPIKVSGRPERRILSPKVGLFKHKRLSPLSYDTTDDTQKLMTCDKRAIPSTPTKGNVYDIKEYFRSSRNYCKDAVLSDCFERVPSFSSGRDAFLLKEQVNLSENQTLERNKEKVGHESIKESKIQRQFTDHSCTNKIYNNSMKIKDRTNHERPHHMRNKLVGKIENNNKRNNDNSKLEKKCDGGKTPLSEKMLFKMKSIFQNVSSTFKRQSDSGIGNQKFVKEEVKSEHKDDFANSRFKTEGQDSYGLNNRNVKVKPKCDFESKDFTKIKIKSEPDCDFERKTESIGFKSHFERTIKKERQTDFESNTAKSFEIESKQVYVEETDFIPKTDVKIQDYLAKDIGEAISEWYHGRNSKSEYDHLKTLESEFMGSEDTDETETTSYNGFNLRLNASFLPDLNREDKKEILRMQNSHNTEKELLTRENNCVNVPEKEEQFIVVDEWYPEG